MADTERRITAKMVLDSSGFNNSIKGVNSQLKNNQSALKLASQGIKSFGSDGEKLRSVQESLTKQIELQSKKIDLYTQSMAKTSTKMQENIKDRDKLKASLEKANAKYDEAVRLYGKESEEAKSAKEAVDKLNKEYNNKQKAIESNAKQIQNYENELNKANTELVRTQGQLNKVSSELKDQDNKWKNASKSLEEHSKKLKDIGNNVSSAGDKILKLTAPLTAVGIAGLKLSVDFEDAMAKVSTIADESEVSMEQMSTAILNLSNESGIAATEIADNVYNAISAGQSTGDAVNFVTNSTKLAKAGFADAGASLDILTTILNAYGMEANEVTKVSDTLVQIQNKGKTTVSELASTMGKIIPTANNLGVSLDQLGAGYALMTSKGIATSETTTYMNSMLNELGKSGSITSELLKNKTGKSFSELTADGQSLGDILSFISEEAKKDNKSLSDMFSSTEAGKAALVLATNDGKAFNDMLVEMGNSSGATDAAFEKVSNTTGNKLKKSLNELMNEGIRLGDTLSPILDKGIDLLSRFIDKISSLSDEQLQSIAKWGAMSIAAGGALKIVGGGISTIGSIAGGLSTLAGVLGTTTASTTAVGTAAGVAGGATGLGALVGGLGSAAVAAAPFVAGATAIGLAGYGIYEVLSTEVVPSVDLFADSIRTTGTEVTAYGEIIKTETVTISEETQKQVQAYLDMDNEVKSALDDLYINSQAITDETCNSMTQKYAQMGETINASLRQSKDNDLATLNEFFANSEAISEEEEQFIINNTSEMYQSKENIINEKTARIKEILETAKKENRELKENEKNEINQIQQDMKTQAIQTLSENEIEAQVILQRMKDYDGRITAEQASEHIKKLNDSRDKAVQAANDEYDKRIAAITKMKNESGVLSEEQANKLIEEAKRQRDGVVESAENTRKDAVDKIVSMNSDIENSVDTSSGKILTTWDKLKNWWNSWKPEGKTFNASISQSSVGKNWTGTNNWSGGLTYMHERGYELYELPSSNLYNLPSGSKIYNHEASEKIVLKTAEKVAENVASRLLSNYQGSGNKNIRITVPVKIDGREVAMATANYIGEELLINDEAYSWRK